MKQALHILRKDVRYLRIEIGLLLVLTAVFAAIGGNWSEFAVEAAALYVVVRLIHAEPIPGDRQFWLTRPYRPMSLLGAKLFFIFAIICVPLGIAQAVMMVRLGYPPAQEMPGLLWTQVLIFFGAALPVAAVAALTASIVPFLSAVLLITVATMVGGLGWQWLFRGLLFHVPVTVDWIGNFVLGVLLSCIAGMVLVWLYRDRRVRFSRLFATIAFYCALALLQWLPAVVPLTIQGWFSKEPSLAANAQVSVVLPVGGAQPGRFRKGMEVPLRILVNGLPEGVEIRADEMSISFEWPGQVWSPATRPGVNPRSSGKEEATLDTVVEMDASLFRAKRDVPMTLRGAAYLTMFGAPERRRFTLRKGPVNVQDGLQCWEGEFAGYSNQTLCRSFFRWPARLVSAEADGGIVDFANSVISYSPFPAELNLNPVEVRWGETIRATEATLVTRKPLAHFRREFWLRGVRLADFAKPLVAPPGQFAR